MPILNSSYFTAWYDNMTSAFGKVCRIKNRHTFKSMPILNSAYFTECRFVIRHITQTETQTETELLRRHILKLFPSDAHAHTGVGYEFLHTLHQMQKHSKQKTCTLPVADPGFSPGGCANSQNCYYFSNFCQKTA